MLTVQDKNKTKCSKVTASMNSKTNEKQNPIRGKICSTFNQCEQRKNIPEAAEWSTTEVFITALGL
ncbi:hypothetical protein HYC85_023226 [Camellia sinensis]|uniref:Uncharacterized protein n=1 Tax=Camellia sinensis TaxID=4442 RepID=A0A7J7GEL3_CAMSI|nr:hypothetical protein HYC85_023226 [Camellia sinensis]